MAEENNKPGPPTGFLPHGKAASLAVFDHIDAEIRLRKLPESQFTHKQLKFIEHYCASGKISSSARNAGYSERSAHQIGVTLLANPKIMEEIERRQEVDRQILNVERENVISTFAAIAFADITDVMSWDNDTEEVIESSSLPKRVSAAIKRVKIRTNKDGSRSVDIEMHDKVGALEKLCKLLGYNAPDKVELVGKDGGPIEIADLTSAIERKLSGLLAARASGPVLPVLESGGVESTPERLEVLGEGQSASA